MNLYLLESRHRDLRLNLAKVMQDTSGHIRTGILRTVILRSGIPRAMGRSRVAEPFEGAKVLSAGSFQSTTDVRKEMCS
jgi:hypothetical protein